MRIIATAHIDATDDIELTDWSDLGATIIKTGDQLADNLYINGTATARADFLRRLAAQATEAADALTGEAVSKS